MVSCPDLPFEPPNNFGGLPAADSSFESSPLVILPVPLEQTTSYRGGTKDGPAALIHASRFMELADWEVGDVPASRGIHTLPALEPRASGPAESLDDIETAVRWLLASGKRVGALGGEHSLTYPIIKAYREVWPDLSVLQFDAHGDLRAAYHGSSFSHASVMRRIVDAGVPTVGLGIRSVCEEEIELIRDRQLARFSGRDVARRRIPMETMLETLTDNVYVTLDLDGFDPSEAPGVGTPEPGGFSWFDFLEVMEALGKRRVIGFDVVELMPIPGQAVSEFLAAKAAYVLASALLRGLDR
ncbi:MAG TPA: agmatinase [Candidatus Eisenbacteria bacterium]